MSRASAWLAAGLALLASCGGGEEEVGGGSEGEALRIAVIPKGTTHEFWKSIHAGALKAGAELGVEVLWKGPMREDDRDDQVKVVEDMIARGVDAIAIAPLDDRALVPVLSDAAREGIPVTILDSGVDWDDYVSFVATDNRKGGVIGARRLGERLGGKGEVLLLRYVEGSASTARREAGFLETLAAEFPEVEVVSSNRYAGATAESAYQEAERLLTRFEDLDGIFCPNESSAFGMLRALDDAGRAGGLTFVGFDSSPKLVEALRAGVIDALVIQNPFAMGELGVRACASHLRGEAVERRIDTGVVLATSENMDEPEIADLLAPDFERWLK